MNRINETTSEGVKHPAAPLLDSSLISKYEDVERRIIYDVKIIHCGDTYQIYKFDKTRSKELGRKSRDGITKIETGENDFYFDTLMKIIKKHNMIMTIEKK